MWVTTLGRLRRSAVAADTTTLVAKIPQRVVVLSQDVGGLDPAQHAYRMLRPCNTGTPSYNPLSQSPTFPYCSPSRTQHHSIPHPLQLHVALRQLRRQRRRLQPCNPASTPTPRHSPRLRSAAEPLPWPVARQAALHGRPSLPRRLLLLLPARRHVQRPQAHQPLLLEHPVGRRCRPSRRLHRKAHTHRQSRRPGVPELAHKAAFLPGVPRA